MIIKKIKNKRKHIIITKVFDSGGSNSHLKMLIRYLGATNVILVLEYSTESIFATDLIKENSLKIKIIKHLHGYARLRYAFATNVKEFFLIVSSIMKILILSIKNDFADLTISAVEPEKHLYFFFIPFIRVNYILHSEPCNAANSPVTHFICNRLLCKNKKIITVSFAMMNAICKQWGISEYQKRFVKVIYNCIIEQKEPHVSAELTKKVITLGHVDQRKNPFLWLEVAKIVTERYLDCEFIWLGNGEYLEDLSACTQMYKNINFSGLTNNPHNFLDGAFIYYQPSLIEPHGIAVVEAMSHSLPCIVSNVGGLPESVKNNYNGLVVEPADIAGHVEAFKILFENNELRHSFMINSYNRFKEKFTYEIFKEKMDLIYNQ